MVGGIMFDYIDKYGDLNFEEKECTVVDLLIFSQIPYIDFNDSIKDNISIFEAWNVVKKYNNKNRGIIYKNAIKLMDLICSKPRYKDIILSDYIYEKDDKSQFGAITITDINNNRYVIFEGTDDSIIGWKEDFELTYMYPTIAQKKGTKYLKNILKKYNGNILVCGHSKGGNLALVGTMNLGILDKKRISKIYSFDGPGLRKREFKSLNYRLIRNKLVNIIPTLSIIGLLLKQENTTVVESTSNGISQHDVNTWLCEDDKLKLGELSSTSIRLDNTISTWLDKHSNDERRRIIEGVFDIFKSCNIDSILDIKENKVRVLVDILKSSYNMDSETKNIIIGSIRLFIKELSSEIISDSKIKLYGMIDKFR